MVNNLSRHLGSKTNGDGNSLGFEEELWLSADKLRSPIDAAENRLGPLVTRTLRGLIDGEMTGLTATLQEQLAESRQLQEKIEQSLLMVAKAEQEQI